jgi:phosphatidylserine/phosphatidylglycerophosphate/cardiolipin synthase-like enzyme
VGKPYPTFHYDLRDSRAEGASLHAMCIVVDDRLTLIISANFTERGPTRNIELGVLTEDRNLPRAWARNGKGW